jgi:hypothetical protein
VWRRAIVVDGRNALPAADLVAAGFAYGSFGRGAVAVERDAADVAASRSGADEPAADSGAAADHAVPRAAPWAAAPRDLVRMD